MENKKILYLSYDGMTDPLGQSQVLPYLCGLAKFGFSFTLVSFEKKQRFKQGKELINQVTAANNIKWLPLPYTKNPPVISTIHDLRQMRKIALQLQKAEPFTMVHCRGHVPALVGLFLKRKFHIKFLFDMRGFWPDEKVDAGAWNLKNPIFKTIYSFFKRKEKQFLQEADHVICLTHKGLEELLTWKMKIKKNAFTVIPCCVDLDLFNPARLNKQQVEKFRAQLCIQENDTVISYLGSIGTWYMLDDMMDFFISLKQTIPRARFLFITLHEHEKIKDAAAKKGIHPHDILICPAKRNEVPAILSLSGYAIFFIKPSYSKISSSPTKQGEIMAMGIPLVCNSGVGDTDMIVKNYHSGLVVLKTTAEEYNNSVRLLLTTTFNANDIREGATQFFSLTKGISAYRNVYESVIC